MENKYKPFLLPALFGALTLMGLNGCDKGPGQPDSVMKCQVDVTALDVRKNGKGRTLVERIQLADIQRTPTTIAYGPALNPKAEITILDGTYYLTGADGGKTKTTHQPSKDQLATFIIAANAGQWSRGEPLPPARNLKDVSAALGRYANNRGCGRLRVFPYKIKAHAKTLEWSATSDPDSLKGTLANVDIIIVGLYDNSGTPRTAIMSGLNIHPHVVIPSRQLSGHLNKVDLEPDARVYVPETHARQQEK